MDDLFSTYSRLLPLFPGLPDVSRLPGKAPLLLKTTNPFQHIKRKRSKSRILDFDYTLCCLFTYSRASSDRCVNTVWSESCKRLNSRMFSCLEQAKVGWWVGLKCYIVLAMKRFSAIIASDSE